MVEKPDWYDGAVAQCASYSNVAGDIMGDIYGAGALSVSANPAFAAVVSEAIDHQVSSGFADMCDLPENLGAFDNNGGGDSGGGDSGGGDTGGGDF
ncbi:hypothetical protein [Erythrobacter sp. CCH5-A1]|jgi:hypothetical protein|uniref:hypothetical protein n=1 Tax=Erythrobacter sp. CCH5-A1 TaxID=1768792 RepID=UPI000AD7C696|nr:hypothetical protein [Erythrobacter sp. CCH5-A1]